MNHVYVKSFLGIILGKGSFVLSKSKSFFATNNACFLMEWALSFDLIFLQIMFIFGNLFLLPAKISTKRTDWENTQVLKFNSADAGKGFLNLVESHQQWKEPSSNAYHICFDDIGSHQNILLKVQRSFFSEETKRGWGCSQKTHSTKTLPS